MPIIEVRNVRKVYSRLNSSRRFFARYLSRVNRIERDNFLHVALDDVSFTVERGESFGLIGANGSGKSTLLRLLAGITVPTSGEVIIRGKVVPLLELGAGFHPLLSGRENIFLNARILGMNREQTAEVFDRIVAFSGLEECIDNPVYTYSSGMYVRLGFSVAVHANPDIFLVDEVLAVGDEDFQRKCLRKIGELKENRKTIIFVSHDLAAVSNLCDRVILLSHGKMIVRRTPRETIDYYLRQTGHSKGIHSFGEGIQEAVFNHGRLALFYEERELTAPQGITMAIRQLGSDHPAVNAEWRVVERNPNGCQAEAEMHRLPIRLRWESYFEQGRFYWRVSMICLEQVAVETVNLLFYLKPLYATWLYGDYEGVFPTILPEDTSWSSVVSPEESQNSTTVLAHENASEPCLHFSLKTTNPYWHLAWCNSDYTTGARVLIATIRFPENQPFQRGEERELGVMEVLVEPSREKAREKAQQMRLTRCLTSGRLQARFIHGSLKLFDDRHELTKTPGAYFTMLINGLWHDSMQLRWKEMAFAGTEMKLEGESRRFPLVEHWLLSGTPDGLHVCVDIEARERLAIEEFNFSICLPKEYISWKTNVEEGVFPEFHSDSSQWRHLNKTYGTSNWISAFSSNLTSITLWVQPENAYRFHMTALNTDYRMESRVIQALCSATSSRILLDAGNHRLFSGKIILDAH